MTSTFCRVVSFFIGRRKNDFSLGLILFVGMIFVKILENLKLPRIIGMLLTGIVLGPQVLNLLDSNILAISSDLRTIALIIILLNQV